MQRDSNRTLRIASTLRQELAQLVREHYDWSASLFVINHIRVSGDLSYADVFCSCLEQQQLQPLLEQLNEDKKFLRHQLMHNSPMKKFPQLRFHADRVQSNSERMEELLKSLKQQAR